jgi:DNA polymerase III epsilon subunit-like protein
MEDLLRFKFDQKYIVFDTETENTNLVYKNRPWEVSILIGTGKKVEFIKNIYPRWDDLSVSKVAAKVTGFNWGEYKNKWIDSIVALDEFESYLYNPEYLIVGQNLVGFDAYIINNWRKAAGRTPDHSYLDRMYDTDPLSRGWKKGSPFNKNEHNLIDYQFRWANYIEKGLKTNLKQLCSDFQIEFDEDKAHRAEYDTRKTFEVFHKLLWTLEI